MSEPITKASLLRFLDNYPDDTKIQVAASICLSEDIDWYFPDELNVSSMNSYNRDGERMIVLGFDGAFGGLKLIRNEDNCEQSE